MTDNQDQQYAHYTKVAWLIYSLVTAVIIVVLVLFVARDDQERFFYAIMPAAAAYVLRPMDKPFSKLIYKYTGVSHPSENK